MMTDTKLDLAEWDPPPLALGISVHIITNV
jgi:hypothetical protein